MKLAIIQARMSSSRLPGKVLKPILGRPMLAHHLERLQRGKHIDKLLVATSQEADDTPIANLCLDLGVDCFRGSLEDVLDRFYHAALPYLPDTVVRLTGDCPLADPEIIDRAIEYFNAHECDYISNTLDRTFPIGLDVEVFRFESLQKAWQEATLPSEREHVTPFLYNHPDRFTIGQMTTTPDMSTHRWTVDEPEDFEFVSAVYEALYARNPHFGADAILTLLEERPELLKINYHIKHGEGYEKSLRADKAFARRAYNKCTVHDRQ
jgi:spore coat polysaccharide biosynthesis protein SpsF